MTLRPFLNCDGRVPVMFRATGPTKAPQVTAVFPCEPADRSGLNVVCMPHVGQVGSVSLTWMKTTRPAKPDQYATFASRLGEPPFSYSLDIRKQVTAEMREVLATRAATKFGGEG